VTALMPHTWEYYTNYGLRKVFSPLPRLPFGTEIHYLRGLYVC
jgi:hypothetical protein